MQDIVSIITALTGLIGTIAGAAISYLSLRHAYRKDKHIIKLSLREGMIVNVTPPGQKNDVSKSMFIFEVVNTGAKEFKVVQIGLQIGRRKGMIIDNPVGSVKLPYALKPDESCSFWTEYEAMKNRIEKPPLHNKIKVKGYVKDYLGNTFWSERMVLVLRETWHYKLRMNVKRKWQTIMSVFLP